MTILDEIVAHKRGEVAARQAAHPVETLLERRPPRLRDFANALREPGVSAICEVKRKSPSAGVLRADLDLVEVAKGYAEHDAAAISVLTDEHFFGGSDEDLRRVRTIAGLPTLRKDFTIDEYQLYESRAIGADAILLIVAILDDETLTRMLAIVEELGLVALVEVHNDEELERALGAGAQIVGVNNRDLKTFNVDLECCLKLRDRIPPDVLAVAESGIHTSEDIARLAAADFDAMLIGEALMTADDPGAKLTELRAGVPLATTNE